jgi:hypothetical protein
VQQVHRSVLALVERGRRGSQGKTNSSYQSISPGAYAQSTTTERGSAR